MVRLTNDGGKRLLSTRAFRVETRRAGGMLVDGKVSDRLMRTREGVNFAARLSRADSGGGKHTQRVFQPHTYLFVGGDVAENFRCQHSIGQQKLLGPAAERAVGLG